ncbi:kinase-like domain-containing protein [Xylogone sp. PMI_703]|nr:kinase-like domain-containing protein [Xylogone sp. PMI_703]
MDPSDLGQVATGLLNMAVATAPAGASQRVLGAIASKIEKVLNTSEFIKGLNKIAPPLICDGQQAPKRLRDSEFVRVSDWCAMYGKHEWSLRPRTFIILHMIGCYEAVDEFVQLGYSDIALPYTAANLPKAVKGDKARRQFLDLQNFVLTAHAEHLEKEGEPHQNVEGNADDYFITVKELGRGSFGQVDHVVGRLSIDHFARKRIPRGRSFKRDREAIKSFENELKALKTLSHRHLVKLISSYTDQNWVGLIMKPVADCNLDYFLRAEDIDQIDRQTCLRRFFGCLATAVDYLHQKQIRHKDIKPANILVKNRAVLLTDFGTSHNWSNDTRSTSSGTSIGFTKRYCAPEVAGCAARNQASDLWSLGCVFLEMGTTLNNRTVDEMRSYFETHGTRGPYVRGNSEAADMWLEELKNSSNSVDDMQPLYLSRDMCQEQPNHRPTAAQVVSEILDFQGDVPYCGHCCDSENGTLRMTNNESAREYFLESDVPQQSFQPLPFIDSPDKSLTALAGPILEENDADSVLEVFPVDCKEVDLPVVKSNWHPPTVEDYEGTVTIVYNLSSAEVIGPFESESNGDGDQIVTSLGSNLAEREMSRSPVDRFLKGCANIYHYI